MVSSRALERAKDFLKLKEEHGGVDGIKKHIKETKWNLWFDDSGTIVSLSKEPNEDFSKKYKHTIFTEDQIDIIKGKNWSLFIVKTNPKSDEIFYLEPRPIDAGVVTSNDRFLQQINKSSSRSYDIKVELTKDKFIVTAHGRLISKYKDISPDNFTASGKKHLTFHLTSLNDPSFLLHTIDIPLVDLITNKQVSREMESDMRQSSIYTIFAVDKYIRT